MDTSTNRQWLPLTEYALRSGMSISTLRRKIKSNTISYKMEEGRYLIRGDDLPEEVRPVMGFTSSDEAVAPRMPASRPTAPEQTAAPAAAPAAPAMAIAPAPVASIAASTSSTSTTDIAVMLLRDELRRMQEDNGLRWKALEARVSGLAKKLELFSEQIAETKMLLKLFEEKLDTRA